MQKEVISTNNAPTAIGPYSQAIKVGGMIFVSGQVPVDPATSTVVEGGIEAQTEQVLKNVKAVLAAAGATLADVVKTTVFMTNMADFAAMNNVYASFFTENPPARAAVQVVKLPRDVQVEIEAIAVVE